MTIGKSMLHRFPMVGWLKYFGSISVRDKGVAHGFPVYPCQPGITVTDSASFPLLRLCHNNVVFFITLGYGVCFVLDFDHEVGVIGEIGEAPT